MLKMSVTGEADIQRIFEEAAPRHARNLLRATVGGVAGEVRKEARKEAPKDSGDLRKAITVKRQKPRGNRVEANVFVVRKKGFYWRFLEYGTISLAARPFFLPALRTIEPRLPGILREQFVKKLESALKRERKRQGGG
ncbi:MAG: HK97 gp10 family phage protein [Thioclava sp.]|nr:HK97-gp10 family putative phage morphogenesis protein [Thioclava sp.]MBD3803562.1 HK97 gp10 family phage protein [Thioclava sp.]